MRIDRCHTRRPVVSMATQVRTRESTPSDIRWHSCVVCARWKLLVAIRLRGLSISDVCPVSDCNRSFLTGASALRPPYRTLTRFGRCWLLCRKLLHVVLPIWTHTLGAILSGSASIILESGSGSVLFVHGGFWWRFVRGIWGGISEVCLASRTAIAQLRDWCIGAKTVVSSSYPLRTLLISAVNCGAWSYQHLWAWRSCWCQECPVDVNAGL